MVGLQVGLEFVSVLMCALRYSLLL